MIGTLMVGLIVVLGCIGLPAATPTPGGTLTIAVPDEPPGLDPTTSPAAAIARIVYNNLREGLVKVDMQGEVVRALGVPYLDRIVFRFIQDPNAQMAALRAGDVDVIGAPMNAESAVELMNDQQCRVIEGLTTTDVIGAMNNSKPPFSDIRVRKAITYAINRDEVIQGSVFGMAKPIGSHMDSLNPYYADLSHLYEYNPQKAKQLLAEAGYPQGFEFVLRLAEPYLAYRRAGEIIASQLAKVGLKAKIEIIEWGQWLARVYRQADYDMTVMGHAEPFDIGIYANPQYYSIR